MMMIMYVYSSYGRMVQLLLSLFRGILDGVQIIIKSQLPLVSLVTTTCYCTWAPPSLRDSSILK